MFLCSFPSSLSLPIPLAYLLISSFFFTVPPLLPSLFLLLHYSSPLLLLSLLHFAILSALHLALSILSFFYFSIPSDRFSALQFHQGFLFLFSIGGKSKE